MNTNVGGKMAGLIFSTYGHIYSALIIFAHLENIEPRICIV
jgi:hypothetical protein